MGDFIVIYFLGFLVAQFTHQSLLCKNGSCVYYSWVIHTDVPMQTLILILGTN